MYERELRKMIEAAEKSGDIIMDVYKKGFEVEIKDDDSPVTEADKKADYLIIDILSKAFPDYGFLTEETPDTEERLSKKYVWIIDPLDGTKEFVNYRGEFATCIALCKDHDIVASVINCPAQNVLFYAVKGEGAYKLPRFGEPVKIHVNDKDQQITVLRSVSFFNDLEQKLIDSNPDKIGFVFARGAAQKFCLVAEGLAEASFRINGNTKEWDLAAGNLLIQEAGGIMVDHEGKPLKFNKPDVYFKKGYRFANKKENLLF